MILFHQHYREAQNQAFLTHLCPSIAIIVMNKFRHQEELAGFEGITYLLSNLLICMRLTN